MKKMILILVLLVATVTGLHAQHLEFVKNNGEHIHHGLPSNASLTFEIDENDELVWLYDGVRYKDVENVIVRDKAYDEAKERETLIELYTALDGDHWTDNTNWCSEKPLGEWHGVSCNYNGRVSFIDLSNNGLKGELPESIENLTYLENFYIQTSSLSGNIPKSFGRMMQLQNLMITWSNLTGPIPDKLLTLPHLWNLNLSNNQLNGEIPETLTFMMDKATEPSQISICLNRFSGKIPDAILRHRNFRNLWPAILMQNGEIGDLQLEGVQIPGPDFELVDMNGVVQKSSELYAKNKQILNIHGTVS